MFGDGARIPSEVELLELSNLYKVIPTVTSYLCLPIPSTYPWKSVRKCSEGPYEVLPRSAIRAHRQGVQDEVGWARITALMERHTLVREVRPFLQCLFPAWILPQPHVLSTQLRSAFTVADSILGYLRLV